MSDCNYRSVVVLRRLALELANRFEKLAVDEEGVMDLSDKNLMDRVRKQADKVLLHKLGIGR